MTLIRVPAALIRDLDGTFSVEDIDVDAPRGAEIAIEIRATGLCQSDLHLASNDLGIPLPLVAGHEVAGVVTAVGPAVIGTAPGDHVLACLIQFCGRCVNCLSGRTHRCVDRSHTLREPAEPPRFSQRGKPLLQMFGVGGFAGSTVVHENQTVVIPEEVPFAQAAVLACSTLTGAGAVLNAAAITHGESVVIIGAGGVGLNAIGAAQLMGAGRVIAVDIAPAKLERARAFGATHTINGAEEDAVKAVMDITGTGADHAFEMIGLSATSTQAVQMTTVGGTTYLVGLHSPGSSLGLDTMADIVAPQRSIQGVYMGGANLKRDAPRYIDHYLAGRLDLDNLISSEVSLADINAGFAAARHNDLARTVITSF